MDWHDELLIQDNVTSLQQFWGRFDAAVIHFVLGMPCPRCTKFSSATRSRPGTCGTVLTMAGMTGDTYQQFVAGQGCCIDEGPEGLAHAGVGGGRGLPSFMFTSA